MRRAVLGILLFVLLGGAMVTLRVTPLDEARAEDEAPLAGLDAREAKRLVSKLRSRSADWWRHRKRMVMVCPQCKGRGQVPWRRGRRRALVECPKCDGNKIFVDKEMYRYCFYDLRSPGFRLQDDIRARVTQEYLQARSGQPSFPTILKRYSVKDIELVDATHGIAYVAKNKDSVARPQRWFWDRERGKSPTWWLYDATADGPWPTDEVVAATEEPVAPEPVVPPPVVPTPVPVEPVAPPPPPVEEPDVPRTSVEAAQKLVTTWTKERNQLKARLIRVGMALDDVEGHPETVADARVFLGEIRTWLDEVKPAYERAVEDVEGSGLGVRFDDRLKVNTGHFKASRRMELVYKMLLVAVPDLDD